MHQSKFELYLDRFCLYFIGPIYIIFFIVFISSVIYGIFYWPSHKVFLWQNQGSGITELAYTWVYPEGSKYKICEHFAEHHTFCFVSSDPTKLKSEVYFLLKKDR